MNNSNYTTSYTKDIEEQERKDRFVASKCLEHLFSKGKNLTIVPTEITDYVDLNCSVVNLKDRLIPFNVEIKERFKNEEQLAKYPNAELKEEKLERMRNATKEGVKLLYMVLLNNKTCLVFDLDNLDWSKVEKRNWRIKRTQLNPNSDYITVPTYFIPYELAVATMDCSGFFNEWTTTIA